MPVVKSVGRRIVQFLNVFRWGPSLALTTTTLTGIFLAAGHVEGMDALASTAILFLLFTHVNLYNYFPDSEEDAVNGRYNPINDADVRLLAIGYLVASLVGGLALAYRYLPTAVVGLVAFDYALGYLYSHSLFRFKEKLFVKNLTIGVGYGSLLVIITSGLVGHVRTLDVVLAVFYGFFSVMGSTIRDLLDVEGDAAADVSTVPNTFGVRGTAHFVTGVVTVQLGVVVAAVVAGVIPRTYLLVLLAAPLLYKWPYFLYSGQQHRINAKGIPGIVAVTALVFLINYVL